MAGRPKRDPRVLADLLRLEFFWQLVFGGMRFGIPGGGTPLVVYGCHGPTESIAVHMSADGHFVDGLPKGIELKWMKSGTLLRDTESERKAWKRHLEHHVEEANEEFTQKIVLAASSDLDSEPELLDKLMSRGTDAAEVRSICQQSKHLKPFRSPTKKLYVHAEEFCRAKEDKRYPNGGKQNRTSSYEKRIDYLARVMAGLSLPKPIAPATAVDLLRKNKVTGIVL